MMTTTARLLGTVGLLIGCTSPSSNVLPQATSVEPGFRYPPLPPGYTDYGGGLLGTPPRVEYSLSLVAGPGGEALWLSRFTHHDSLGKAHWELRAQRILPTISSGMSVARLDCSLDHEPNAGVVAIGTWIADTLVNIRAAWLALPSVERIDTISPERVACSYEEDRD